MVDPARYARARLALDGLSVGDAFGERFFLPHEQLADAIGGRWEPAGTWRWTDDTEMSVVLVEELAAHGAVEPDRLIRAFAERADFMRGYGQGAHRILGRVREGADWGPLSRGAFEGRGSFGNGAAMRVAPLGAYFADEPARLDAEAERSAVVTHAHPEGVAGAIVVARAAGFAWRTRAAAFDPHAFFDCVLDGLDAPFLREGVELARATLDEEDVALAAQRLGNGAGVSAPDTVPLCLWALCRCPDDFEAAMWLTVSALGDRDTTCAIVGGMLAPRLGAAGIPERWLRAREALPTSLPLTKPIRPEPGS